MSRPHLNPPPEVTRPRKPGAPEPCLPCMMFAKGAQMKATETEWQAMVADGDDKDRYIAYVHPANRIRDAVAFGIWDVMPSLGRIPCCWDHLAGAVAVEQQAPGIQPAAGPLPPGFLNGGRIPRPRGQG